MQDPVLVAPRRRDEALQLLAGVDLDLRLALLRPGQLRQLVPLGEFALTLRVPQHDADRLAELAGVVVGQLQFLPHVLSEPRQGLLVDRVEAMLPQDPADVRPHGSVVELRAVLELGDMAGEELGPKLRQRLDGLDIRILGLSSFSLVMIDRPAAQLSIELERLRTPPLGRSDRVHADRRHDAAADGLCGVERVGEVDVDMLAGSVFEVWAAGDFQISHTGLFPPLRFLFRQPTYKIAPRVCNPAPHAHDGRSRPFRTPLLQRPWAQFQELRSILCCENCVKIARIWRSPPCCPTVHSPPSHLSSARAGPPHKFGILHLR